MRRLLQDLQDSVHALVAKAVMNPAVHSKMETPTLTLMGNHIDQFAGQAEKNGICVMLKAFPTRGTLNIHQALRRFSHLGRKA